MVISTGSIPKALEGGKNFKAEKSKSKFDILAGIPSKDKPKKKYHHNTHVKVAK